MERTGNFLTLLFGLWSDRGMSFNLLMSLTNLDRTKVQNIISFALKLVVYSRLVLGVQEAWWEELGRRLERGLLLLLVCIIKYSFYVRDNVYRISTIWSEALKWNCVNLKLPKGIFFEWLCYISSTLCYKSPKHVFSG